MKHTIKFAWAGSTDPDDRSGTARYTVGRTFNCDIRMLSLQDADIN